MLMGMNSRVSFVSLTSFVSFDKLRTNGEGDALRKDGEDDALGADGEGDADDKEFISSPLFVLFSPFVLSLSKDTNDKEFIF